MQGPNYWSFGLVDVAQFVPRCPQSPPWADDGYSLHCHAPANDLVAHDNAILLSKAKKLPSLSSGDSGWFFTGRLTN